MKLEKKLNQKLSTVYESFKHPDPLQCIALVGSNPWIVVLRNKKSELNFCGKSNKLLPKWLGYKKKHSGVRIKHQKLQVFKISRCYCSGINERYFMNVCVCVRSFVRLLCTPVLFHPVYDVGWFFFGFMVINLLVSMFNTKYCVPLDLTISSVLFLASFLILFF